MPQIIRHAGTAAAVLALITAASTSGAAHADGGGKGGGYSFNSATGIKPGAAVQQELTVGDLLFWKIVLRPGQRLDVQTSVEVPGGYNPGPSPHYERLGVRIYDAVRQPMLCDGASDGTEMIYAGHATAESGGRFTAKCTIGTVDYKPIEQAGTYYVQAGIGGATLTRGTALPLTITATTGTGVTPKANEDWTPGSPADGTPGQQPADTPEPSPSASVDMSATESVATASQVPPWMLLVGALLVGSAAALGTTVFRRARR